MAITPRSETQVLLHDDFNGRQVNADLWHFPEWAAGSDNPSYYGRTQIRQSLPPVANGVLKLKLDTYNPTGYSLYGSEIISDAKFSLSECTGIAFEARARLLAPPMVGMVGGIFAYEYQSASAHDEITFELLSNDAAAGRQRVLTNAYDEQPLGAGDFAYVPMPTALTSYHTYRIEWLAESVRWFVDGRLVREETATVPDDPLQLHLNFWAPGPEWPDAYDSRLQPAPRSGDNRSYTFEVDYAHVARIAPASGRPTEGNDRLIGSNAADRIGGLGGNDTLLACAGADTLDGGSGNDSLRGGDGNDVALGGSGNDTLDGGSGNDALSGGSGSDRLSGGSGNDTLDGGSSNDVLRGGSGRDRLIGGSGADRFDFNAASESPASAADVIAAAGGIAFAAPGGAAGNGDVIDLADVYSGVLVFRPAGGAFTGIHQVRVVASGGHSVVQVNLSGNSSPEMQIVIDDGAIASTAYTANDFFL